MRGGASEEGVIVMQYLLSVIHEGTSMATAQEGADIDVFNDRLQEQGYWVFAGGLGVPDNATTIDNRGAETVITDGPFVETKEYLVGFWIIEALISMSRWSWRRQVRRRATGRSRSGRS